MALSKCVAPDNLPTETVLKQEFEYDDWSHLKKNSTITLVKFEDLPKEPFIVIGDDGNGRWSIPRLAIASKKWAPGNGHWNLCRLIYGTLLNTYTRNNYTGSSGALDRAYRGYIFGIIRIGELENEFGPVSL